MNYLRAITVGALVWSFIFISFTILSFIPSLQHSLNLQAIIVSGLIVPYAIFGASIYYKSGVLDNGLKVGFVMTIIALILDALITVPFVELPKGGSYVSFYSFPLLWLMALVNTSTVFLYWFVKVKGRVAVVS